MSEFRSSNAENTVTRDIRNIERAIGSEGNIFDRFKSGANDRGVANGVEAEQSPASVYHI